MITLIIITTIWLFVTFCVCLELIRSLLHSIHPTWSPARSRDNRIVGILLKDRWHYLLLFILKIDIICLIISTVQWKSIQGLLISSVLCASQNWKLKQTLIKHNKVHIVRSWWSWVLRSYSIHTCCNSLKDERSNIFTHCCGGSLTQWSLKYLYVGGPASASHWDACLSSLTV